jgi:hypothetical protein
LPTEKEKQKSREAHASNDAQCRAVSDKERTYVAELAYGLYE